MSQHKYLTLPHRIVINIGPISNTINSKLVEELADHIREIWGAEPTEEELIDIENAVGLIHEIILSHAEKGINVTSPKYLRGIENGLKYVRGKLGIGGQDGRT